jgi:cation transport regulator ChaC
VTKKNYERQSETEDIFTRAAWEMMRDTESDYEVRCEIDIALTAQRGVFYIAIRAWSTIAGEGSRRIAYVQGSYPNGRAGTMSSYLYSLANSLAQMCMNVRGEDERIRASADKPN